MKDPGTGQDGRRAVDLLRNIGWSVVQPLSLTPVLAVGVMLIYIAEGAAPFVLVRTTQHLVNLAAGARHEAGGLWPWVPSLVAMLIALAVSQGGGRQLFRPLQERMEQTVEYILNERRLTKASLLPLRFFEESAARDILSRAGNPGRKACGAFNGLLTLVRGLISVCMIAGLFWTVSPVLPFVLLAVVLPQAIVALKVSAEMIALAYGQTEDQRRVAYLQGLLTSRFDQKELRTFGLYDHVSGLWQVARRVVRVESARKQFEITKHHAPIATTGTLVPAVVAAMLGVALLHGRINLGRFVALFAGVEAVMGAMHHVVVGLRQLLDSSGEVAWVRDFFGVEVDAGGGALSFPAPLTTGIELRHVSFAYTPERPILRDVNLMLRAGERLALVGVNGAGKSTLAKCLLGLYEPQGGVILADGVEYGKIDRASLRQAVGAVYQQYLNVELTVADAIAFGRPSSSEAIRAAASAADAEAFIEALPYGFDTPIGHLLPGAKDLSGGEWQKLAIARGVLRNTALLVLDEPAAALDPQAEAVLYEQLARVAGGRACLLISHRLGFARLADRIAVLKDGVIVEQGSHEELLAMQGEYAGMWKEQAQWYQ